DRVLIPLQKDMPELRIVLEHITTKQAAQYVTSGSDSIGATITPHHLLYNRNVIFHGSIQPHYYCLPILKHETDRQALVDAATGDCDRFFAGTDSAPHPKELKEHPCGCAGCYTALHALELYVTAFEQISALDSLEAFTSFNGADFYRLPRNTGKVTLKRESWIVPDEVQYGNTTVVPLAAGESISWKLL
ncbi:MAG: dihydroorotase, partial [Burkholderiaceae bacterium]|nr:dihydroorotase [Burkholderiaceae bacterium]